MPSHGAQVTHFVQSGIAEFQQLDQVRIRFQYEYHAILLTSSDAGPRPGWVRQGRSGNAGMLALKITQ